MTKYSDAVLLRLFIGESDQFEGQPLYESIVLRAREAGLSGATVLRGPMGFGRTSRLHTSKILRLSDDLPLVIEMIDAEEKIVRFVDDIGSMLGSGIATLENVRVMHFGDGKA